MLSLGCSCDCHLIFPSSIERVTSMLPAEKKQQGLNMIPRHEPFEVLYRLNCDNLCADFTEDIEFRFSFGITSLIQRFMGKGKPNPFVMKNYTESVRCFHTRFILCFLFFFSALFVILRLIGILSKFQLGRFERIRSFFYQSSNFSGILFWKSFSFSTSIC